MPYVIAQTDSDVMRGRLVLAAMIALTPAASAKPDPAQAVQGALRGGGVQTELPAEAETETGRFKLPDGLASFLLWGGVIAGVAMIAFAMKDSLPGFDRSRRLAAPDNVADARAKADAMSAAQIEADDLAAQGRYAEAMHVLLLRALAELRERLQVSFADSLTSREILRRAPLESAAKQAFAHIIGDVELTHFGDALAARDDYLNCRGQYDTLRRALAGAPA
jgi:hypothetical protein